MAFRVHHLTFLDNQTTPETFGSGLGSGSIEAVGPVSFMATRLNAAIAKGFAHFHVHNYCGRAGPGPRWTGRYKQANSYRKNEIVRVAPGVATYGNKAYVAKLDATNIALSNGTYWAEYTSSYHPAWNSGTVYVKGDCVRNGSFEVFVALQASTNQALPEDESVYWKKVHEEFLRGVYDPTVTYARDVLVATWYYQPRYAKAVSNNTGKCPVSDSSFWTPTWAATGSLGEWNVATAYTTGQVVQMPKVFRKSMLNGNAGRSPVLGITASAHNGSWAYDGGLDMTVDASVLRRSDQGNWLRSGIVPALSAFKSSFTQRGLYLGFTVGNSRFDDLLLESPPNHRAYEARLNDVIYHALRCGANALRFDYTSNLQPDHPIYGEFVKLNNMGVRIGIESWPERYSIAPASGIRNTHLGVFDVYVPGQSVYDAWYASTQPDGGSGTKLPMGEITGEIIVQLDYEPGSVNPAHWDYIAGATFSNQESWMKQWLTAVRDKGMSAAISHDFMTGGNTLATFMPDGSFIT